MCISHHVECVFINSSDDGRLDSRQPDHKWAPRCCRVALTWPCAQLGDGQPLDVHAQGRSEPGHCPTTILIWNATMRSPQWSWGVLVTKMTLSNYSNNQCCVYIPIFPKNISLKCAGFALEIILVKDCSVHYSILDVFCFISIPRPNIPQRPPPPFWNPKRKTRELLGRSRVSV